MLYIISKSLFNFKSLLKITLYSMEFKISSNNFIKTVGINNSVSINPEF